MHFVPENLHASSNITRSTGGVFISYSRKDYYFAESLTFSLIQRDVAAWLDVKDLQPGVDWEERLQSAIDNASHLVLVASPDSLHSPNVAVEWKRALARGIPVIVAHLRGYNVPAELARMPRVNFHGRFKPLEDQDGDQEIDISIFLNGLREVNEGLFSLKNEDIREFETIT